MDEKEKLEKLGDLSSKIFETIIEHECAGYAPDVMTRLIAWMYHKNDITKEDAEKQLIKGFNYYWDNMFSPADMYLREKGEK